jgi:hypothetical protein
VDRKQGGLESGAKNKRLENLEAPFTESILV